MWNVSHVQPSTEHFICNSLTVINWATPETFKCHNFTSIEMTVNATVVLLVSTWQSDIHHRFAGSPHVHPCPGSSSPGSECTYSKKVECNEEI